MKNNVLIEKIISKERLEPYLSRHKEDFNKAISHYKSNILISEAFYPLLAILEVSLRNSIDYQLTKHFNDRKWFENIAFVRIASHFQIDRISEAKANILSEKKEITPGRILSELSFGFWTSLFKSLIIILRILSTVHDFWYGRRGKNNTRLKKFPFVKHNMYICK